MIELTDKLAAPLRIWRNHRPAVIALAMAAFALSGAVFHAYSGISEEPMVPPGAHSLRAEILIPASPPAMDIGETKQEARVPLPAVLSEADAERYRIIFALQEDGHWQEADRVIRELKDRVLIGHTFAQRYMHKNYKPEYNELRAWVRYFSDHPQAVDIHRLAVAKRKSTDARLPEISSRPLLSGYGDSNGIREGAPEWQAGLAAWQKGDISTAARYFRALAGTRGVNSWETSRAAFWAYRAYTKIGAKRDAATYLSIASEYPRTFYGVLACKILGKPLDVQAEPLPDLDGETVEAMYHEPAVKRVVALAQVKEQVLAERELRALFPMGKKERRVQLLALAQTLDLPAVQITMARNLTKSGIVFDSALYPTPDWEPTAGFAVDPALVFAFARQESGFHPGAKSPVGAMGVMQLMPKTARMMQRLTDSENKGSLNEPENNIALGQTYLRHLLGNKLVEGNLIYLAASYNAGPGRVAEWKKNPQMNADPLMFMESIPLSETRNYVGQVLTSYWIYQEMEGRRAGSALALAQGQWPRYQADDVTVADNSDTRL